MARAGQGPGTVGQRRGRTWARRAASGCERGMRRTVESSEDGREKGDDGGCEGVGESGGIQRGDWVVG